tara:strand:+ start:939 stop:1343 length:405 start_codon:yes stop_codon:yes gene_type:complete
MATVREYGYYIKGNKVAIVEKDSQFDNDVNSKDYGPGSNRAQWKSPLADVTNGLEFQYVYSPTSGLTDEDSEIDLSLYLSKALVYYVKAKLSEDAMNIEAKEYFMSEFRKMVEKYNNTRVAGLRIQSAGFHAIR